MFRPPVIEQIPLPCDFRSFDPVYCDSARTLDSYSRNLPHWRYEGATYFVTFRLNDSVPSSVADELKVAADAMLLEVEEERAAFGGQLSQSTLQKWEAFQKRQFQKLETVMDAGHGSCCLRGPEIRGLVANALMHFDGERCRLSAFVIMPNHVHALCQPMPGHPLEEACGSWKRYSAGAINRKLARTGQLWQRESFDRIVRDGGHFRRVVRYIVRNPVKARLREDEATVWLSDEIRAANVERVWL